MMPPLRFIAIPHTGDAASTVARDPLEFNSLIKQSEFKIVHREPTTEV